jgi:hypothetical protein
MPRDRVLTAADLARHEKLIDPDGRAQQLRNAAARRRLTNAERLELMDILGRIEADARARLTTRPARKPRGKRTPRAAR